MPDIDTKNRDVLRGNEAGPPKKGAVSTQGDEEIHPVVQASGPFRARGCTWFEHVLKNHFGAVGAETPDNRSRTAGMPV